MCFGRQGMWRISVCVVVCASLHTKTCRNESLLITTTSMLTGHKSTSDHMCVYCFSLSVILVRDGKANVGIWCPMYLLNKMCFLKHSMAKQVIGSNQPATVFSKARAPSQASFPISYSGSALPKGGPRTSLLQKRRCLAKRRQLGLREGYIFRVGKL